MESGLLGLFLASLGLSTAVAGTALLTSDSTSDGCAVRPPSPLRFWTMFLGLFGIIGAPLTLLQLAAPVPIAVAVATAAVGAWLIATFFHETSQEVGLTHLAGSEARVLLPVGTTTGKVVVQTMASRVELPARSDDGSLITRGCRVLVAFVEDGVAQVTPLDSSRPR